MANQRSYRTIRAVCSQWLGVMVCLFWLGLTGACTSGRELTLSKETNSALSYEQARKYDYYFLEATRLKQKEDYAAAMELYEHCLALNPHSAAAMYELAQFYLYLEQPQRAHNMLQKAVELEPDNFWYQQMLGAYYQSKQDYPNAIKVYEQLVERFPNRSELQMALIDLYNYQKDYQKVILALDKLELKEGKSEQISMNKFRVYLQMNEREKAFQEIESLSKEYPNDLRYSVLLGDAYLNNERPEDAYSIYQKVLDIEPDNAMAQMALISYYDQLGKDTLMREQLQLVLDNPKVNNEARLNIVRQMIMDSEQSDRDSTRILQLFDRLLEKEQENADMAMLCYSYMQAKKMSDDLSRPVLEKVLSIEPENTMARYSLLMMAVRKNDYAEAALVCEPALLYNPEELAFYYYLGISYFQTDRRQDALETFQKGVQQVTEESDKGLVSDFYSMIGDLSHTMGNKEEAYVAYDSALVYNPNNIGVLNNYAYFLSLEHRDLDKAEEMSFKTVKAEPKNDTYLDTYAWILFEKGRYTEARIYIDEAMKNGGEQSGTIVEHCGDIYYMLGDKEKALEFWKQAEEMEDVSNILPQKIKQQKYIAE